jgi:dihydroorotase
LDEIVPMVTSNAARMTGHAGKLGTLAVGAPADISVLDDHRGPFTFRDNAGGEAAGDRLLAPAFCLKDGVRFDADAPILPAITA